MLAAGLVLGCLIGIALGLLGGGGSVLTVPVLVYVLGFGAKEAIAISLAVVGVASAAGVVGHWQAGNVNVRTGLAFGAVAMLGTFAGTRLAAFLPGSAQLTLFGGIMITAAVLMLRSPARRPDPTRLRLARATTGLLLAEGVGVGVLTGLVGVGGGFLIVPALVLLARLPMHEAVGTSLLVIAMNSGVGFFGYMGQVDIAWRFVGLLTAVTIPGIAAGTYFIRFVPQDALRRAFALLLLAIAGYILYQNLSIVLAVHAGEAVTGG